MDKSSQLILVTGGAGLVGNELIRQLLADGYKVRAAVHRNPLNLKHSSLEVVNTDVLDVVGLEEAMEGITQVYHCAALVSYVSRDKEQLFRLNIEGTANIVNTCIDAGVQKLVHVSSVAALGRIRNGKVDEQMNWTEDTSNSNYGKSKYLSEMEVWRGVAEGLNAIIVNPSLILGPGDWNSGSTAIFKSLYEGFNWFSKGVSGFVDVRDVARAMNLLMESNISGERYILSGQNASYQKVFSEISRCFGKQPPKREINAFLAGLVWRLESIKYLFTRKAPLVTEETARTSLAKVFYDNAKILHALPGFQFTPLEDTIAHTCTQLQTKHGF